MTDAIRDVLRSDGRLGTDERQFISLRPRNLTEAQRGDKAEYHPGEIVQFVQNAKGFTRGERVTVTGAADKGLAVQRANGTADILPLREAKKFQVYRQERVSLAKGDRMRITMNGFTEETRRGLASKLAGKKAKDRLDNGAVYEVDGFTKTGDIKLSNGFIVPKNYGGIAHGYVVTSHASQGKTVDVSLVALGQESFAAANKEQFYVSVSRGREAVRLYTDDKPAMMEAVQGSAARLSATELMQAPPAKRKPTLTQRLIRTGVIQRAYAAIRERMAAHNPTTHHQPHQEGLSLG